MNDFRRGQHDEKAFGFYKLMRDFVYILKVNKVNFIPERAINYCLKVKPATLPHLSLISAAPYTI